LIEAVVNSWRRIFTVCVSRRRRIMYCRHARLCVCLSVCLSAAVRPHYCTDPDVTWGRGRGCSLVVHYWADLQSGHGLRCYGNITRTAGWAGSARAAGRRPVGDDGRPQKPRAAYGKRARPARRRPAADGGGFLNITAAVWTAGFHWWLSGNKKSERKMLASTCLYSLYAWL